MFNFGGRDDLHSGEGNMKVGPKLKVKQLTRKQGLELRDGRERHGALPAVISDAKAAATSDPIAFPHCDRTGYAKNRELAERISDAVEELKVTDEHGPHFILAWRLYPNQEHPRWQNEDPHFCGCSCGNVAPLPGRKKKKKKKTSKKKAPSRKTTGAAKKSSKKKSKSKSKSKSKGRGR
jgi:hypothetical protein